MLPQLGGPKLEDQIHIKSYPDEADEIMHGIGLRLSSHLEHGGETSNNGACAASAELAAREKSFFKPTKDNYAKLERIFGDPIKHMMSTDIADATYPRVCQHLPLPCAKEGQPCMTREMFVTAMTDANRQFCDRYTGNYGGMAATRLSIHPFMKEIKDALFASVTKDRGELLTIFSGHDTVIAPVLAALGVYRQKDLCVWPPYASRIVFEVYVTSSAAFAPLTHERARDDVMVRVIYNGLDITRAITACRSFTKDVSVPLCPLGAIEKQVDSLILPYASIDEACSAGNVEALTALVRETVASIAAENEKTADTEKSRGADFVAKYLMSHAKAIKTPSGLVYDEKVAGVGAKATLSSQVTVHYHGTLIDGSVFDSSKDRGDPITFSLESVIAGWKEGLQMMGKGGTATLVIPGSLAYGEEGSDPQIPGDATLVFDVELLDIK